MKRAFKIDFNNGEPDDKVIVAMSFKVTNGKRFKALTDTGRSALLDTIDDFKDKVDVFYTEVKASIYKDFNRERKILFRGRNMETKEWVYGNYFQPGAILLIPDYIQPNGMLVIPDTTHTLVVRVDPDTVGQLILAKDHKYNRMEVDVWEGDIVKQHGRIFALTFYYYDDHQGYDLDLDEDFEILGNIHDHPERLK